MKRKLIWFGVAVAALVSVSRAYCEERNFTSVAIEYQGTRIWTPATFIVKKGDKVNIKIINNIKSEPNTHGFAIDAFGIKEVIARGEPKTVSFTAEKTGIFSIHCHLHPAHVGGQILVLE